jgi:hypothetical protein
LGLQNLCLILSHNLTCLLKKIQRIKKKIKETKNEQEGSIEVGWKEDGAKMNCLYQDSILSYTSKNLET